MLGTFLYLSVNNSIAFPFLDILQRLSSYSFSCDYMNTNMEKLAERATQTRWIVDRRGLFRAQLQSALPVGTSARRPVSPVGTMNTQIIRISPGTRTPGLLLASIWDPV